MAMIRFVRNVNYDVLFYRIVRMLRVMCVNCEPHLFYYDTTAKNSHPRMERTVTM